MNNWIFIATNRKIDDKTMSGRDVYNQRMEDQFWGLGELTPNRKNLQVGDRVVFYVGIPDRVFAGTAVIASPCFKLSNQEREYLSHGRPFFQTEYGVRLSDIDTWDVPIFVPDLVPDLDFIINKEYWGSYFQGGTRGVSDKDYSVIVTQIPSTGTLSSLIEESSDFESAKQFALEAHLEEFIHNNWAKITWGRSLRLYEISESNGRQFPAGTWSIDFLAVDNDTNDLIVIELKRGQTSDETVGQILRYMGWVRENVATDRQEVKGIIVCHEVDKSLQYAVKQIENVMVLTYSINFVLRPVEE